MDDKYKYLPKEMKKLKRFIGWRKENSNGKIAKLPFSLIDGKSIGWNKEVRWLSFNQIMDKEQDLGFVLSNDGIICVDLDHAISKAGLIPMAKDIVEAFKGTYMELSQSCQGIHIFCKGKIADNLIRPSHGIEIYKNNRYIALTGNVGDGRYFPISNRILDKQEELDKIYKKWAQEKPSIQSYIRDYQYESLNYDSRLEELSLDEILATMERTNKKASELLSGGSITGDHSRDDFIFLVLARNYTNGNPKMMRDLFLMTPLNRLGTNEKRKDDQKYLEYVENSISSVLNLGNFRAFDWSKHFAYKERMKEYERV
jgi:primase-polymerase (primpol)-like protein